MAIYHMSAQVIGRSSGRSATAASAYRAGEKILDERTGELHDYTRKSGVDYEVILSPEHVGEWAQDRGGLWNKVELAEKRKDAQLAREINIAIPVELDKEQGRELVKEYAQKNFVSQGMIADICIHEEGKKNPHAHIMLSMREADKDGFTKKNRDWNDRANLEKWREEWAHSCNKSLEKAGQSVRIDHRTLEAQGVDREPTTHIGPTATEIERKGRISDRGEINREIESRNQDYARLKDALHGVTVELERIGTEQRTVTEKGNQQDLPKSLGTYINKEPTQEQPKEQRSISGYLSRPQEPEKERYYHEQTATKVIAYMEQQTNIKNIQDVYSTIEADAKPKTLEGELVKNKNFQNALNDYKHYVQLYEQSKARCQNLQQEVNNLGLMDSIKYKMGKHELNSSQVEAEKQKKHYHTIGLAVTEKANQMKENLSKELQPEIDKHNKRAVEAQKTLERVRPTYNKKQAEYKKLVAERKEQEKAQSREWSRFKDRGRGR